MGLKSQLTICLWAILLVTGIFAVEAKRSPFNDYDVDYIEEVDLAEKRGSILTSGDLSLPTTKLCSGVINGQCYEDASEAATTERSTFVPKILWVANDEPAEETKQTEDSEQAEIDNPAVDIKPAIKKYKLITIVLPLNENSAEENETMMAQVISEAQLATYMQSCRPEIFTEVDESEETQTPTKKLVEQVKREKFRQEEEAALRRRKYHLKEASGQKEQDKQAKKKIDKERIRRDTKSKRSTKSKSQQSSKSKGDKKSKSKAKK